MPARTNGSVATATTTKAKRFELPALDFKFGSLTDGTNIPPPLPSPIEEEPADLKLKENKPSATTTATTTNSSKTNGAQPSADNANATSPSRTLARAGLKRPADDIPASPTLSSRPGSIRRLFSRNLLNTAYANAEGTEGALATSNSTATVGAGSIMRPESRSDGSILDERRARRSSGWFRRLRGGGAGDSVASSGASVNGAVPSSPLSKRSSVLFADARKQQQQQQAPAKPAGPPPPMIPELGELETKIDLDEGGLGSDLFKNIK